MAIERPFIVTHETPVPEIDALLSYSASIARNIRDQAPNLAGAALIGLGAARRSKRFIVAGILLVSAGKLHRRQNKPNNSAYLAAKRQAQFEQAIKAWQNTN